MVNVDRDLPKQEESEELVNAPLGFDLARAESICSRCDGAALNLGIEKADKYCPERRWFKCTSCLGIWSIIIGPARELTQHPQVPPL